MIGEGGEHFGYTYHRTKREALKALHDPDNEAADWWGGKDDAVKHAIDAMEVPRTKTEVLALLDWWASHPNNG